MPETCRLSTSHRKNNSNAHVRVSFFKSFKPISDACRRHLYQAVYRARVSVELLTARLPMARRDEIDKIQLQRTRTISGAQNVSL
eukprot:255064-Pyramimonas_sp.AAC.1